MRSSHTSFPRSVWFLALVLPLLVTGCELFGSNEDERDVEAATGVFVANQGNFGDGNGSVTTYDPSTGTVTAAAVGGLGSIVQSIALVDDRLYVTSNTGHRVDVFDASTYERIAQIEDVTSPRYLAVAGPTKAYVTNLYADAATFSGGKVTVVDLTNDTKGVEIEIGGNPEGAVVVGDRLYVANGGFGATSTVVVIDTGTDEVVDEIDVDCDAPRYLAADADDEVFVFCAGQTIYDEDFNPIGQTDGAVRVLDGATGEIVARIAVDGQIATVGPGQDAYAAPEAGVVFAVKNSDTLLQFDTETNALTAEISSIGGDPIGAVAYDAASEQLYVGHVPGFTEGGTVTIHDTDGTQVGSFPAGIAPSYIAFQRRER